MCLDSSDFLEESVFRLELMCQIYLDMFSGACEQLSPIFAWSLSIIEKCIVFALINGNGGSGSSGGGGDDGCGRGLKCVTLPVLCWLFQWKRTRVT